ncbi:MAG: glutamate--cysteine ligase, partial [Acidobacteria bacterium]|nr:glutamate--cysteine ligase [Acidobacteriota bacterium]
APTGMKFGDFLAGRCKALTPAFGDWADHLTTIFTDARLKQHLELRSADCGSLPMALAFQAFWKGLLYGAGALDEALRLAPNLNREDALELRAAVARDALEVRTTRVNVLALAKEAIALAVEGLSRIAPEELPYLDLLREQVIVDEQSPADILLGNWHNSWHNSMPRVIEHLRIA